MPAVDGLITVRRIDPRTATVTVGNDPLGAAADELADVVAALMQDGTEDVVVEFAGSGLLNSKLLDGLVRASGRRPPRGGGGIAVVISAGYARQMLSISEAGGVLVLADSRDEALELLRES